MFKKNIEVLEKVNKNLANRLINTDIKKASNGLGALKNEFGEYILTKDGTYIDDTPSPLKSAEEIYSSQIKSPLTRYDFIVVFGLGLGNLLDFVHNKSMSQIIIYEPDINILRFTFEYVDLAKYLSDGRVYITNNLNECTDYVKNKFLIDDKIEFVYIKNYALLKPSEFNLLTDRMYETCRAKIVDMNTIKVMSKFWIKNIYENICTDKLKLPLQILENKFKGKTALILGAGPSLKDNIEEIKANRDKFVIFAVHRTLQTLKQNSIIPDFCVVVDARWLNDSLVKDNDYLSKINFITDVKSDSYLNNFEFKNNFIYFTEGNTFNEKLKHSMHGELQLMEPAGTSTISAYKCAKLLGCKNLVFAGIDLAFKDDTVYCDGKNAVINTQTSVKINNRVLNTTEVKSITGDYVKTRVDYATFVKQFEKLFSLDKHSNLYNLTTFGAFINGMKYETLTTILSKLQLASENINDTIITCIDENAKNLQHKIYEKSYKILNDEKEKIKPIITLVNEWFEMYSEHPSFYDYAYNIVTQITSTMILENYVQIELLKFTKLIFDKDEPQKLAFVKTLFTDIKNYEKCLNNLI